LARVPYAQRNTSPPEHQALFDRLEVERGNPVENVFLALANVPECCEAVLTMAMALRKSTVLDRRFRELAVLTIGLLTKSEYEFDHHWNSAVKAGVRHEQLAALSRSDTAATVFNGEERAVIAYAKEATLGGEVSDETWETLCGFLDQQARIELVLTVAWYNAVVRILLPLKIDREEWFERL
jgi:alkylhydroperoxidase family enzyme